MKNKHKRAAFLRLSLLVALRKELLNNLNRERELAHVFAAVLAQ